ncbi:MAG: ROK family protein [Lachnospiraceae bacterium]|nr:ROK family protein [Lachnospiraceae bacterium]
MSSYEEYDMNTYLGLDFGGTKLLIGETDEEGNILNTKRYKTGLTDQQEAVTCIMEALEDYKATTGFQGQLKAAGLGIVGIVNRRRGEWISMSHEVKNPPIPLQKLLEEKLQVPCAIDNDVRSATTAELLLGRGQTSEDFIYLNVGTGLAAGIVTDGRLIRGANNNSGEIGHMVVDINSTQQCVCHRKGCAENIVSGTGFTAQIRREDAAELLDEDGKAKVVELFRKADAGDPLCQKITDYAAKTLACVIMNLVRVSDPDTVILGGGIISDGWLLEKTRNYLEAETMRGVSHGIVLSSFDPRYAGLIGAASLGMDCIRKK